MLGAPGLVLHAGAGWTAAIECDGVHEPVDNWATPCQPQGQEENRRDTQPQENVRRGK